MGGVFFGVRGTLCPIRRRMSAAEVSLQGCVMIMYIQ